MTRVTVKELRNSLLLEYQVVQFCPIVWDVVNAAIAIVFAFSVVVIAAATVIINDTIIKVERLKGKLLNLTYESAVVLFLYGDWVTQTVRERCKGLL